MLERLERLGFVKKENYYILQNYDKNFYIIIEIGKRGGIKGDAKIDQNEYKIKSQRDFERIVYLTKF